MPNWRARWPTRRVDLVAFEKDKIKGAMRTDFVLSAEIIAITLGTVAAAPFSTQVAVLVGIALLMTVGVYGFVAGIVKLDDAGLHLSRAPARSAWAGVKRALGARHPARRAVADEGAVGGRHGGHVPGRRRHPHARRAAAAPCHRGAGAARRRSCPARARCWRALTPSLLDAWWASSPARWCCCVVSGGKQAARPRSC